MTTMPLPPPPVDALGWERRPQRAGELTPAWRTVFFVGWVLVVLVFAAVWKSGRTIGLSPWWLGPSGDPHHLAIKLIPFVLPLAILVATLRNVRFLPWLGVATACGTAAVAAGDLGRFTGLAVVELAAAGAGLLVSLASLAGLLSVAPPRDRVPATAPDARTIVAVTDADATPPVPVTPADIERSLRAVQTKVQSVVPGRDAVRSVGIAFGAVVLFLAFLRGRSGGRRSIPVAAIRRY